MTNTVYHIEQTRTVRIRKETRFERGTFTTLKKLQQAGYPTAPAWATPVDKMQMLMTLSNDCIAENPGLAQVEWTPADLVIIAEVMAELTKLGFGPNDYNFGKNVSVAFNGGDKESIWVGVRMNDLDDRFIGHNGKPVTLQEKNFITTTTFLGRIKASKQLFVRG